MKDFLWRFALIGGFTLAGLLYIWPPKERLKLGIDLSGGTILVYQAKPLPTGVTMDQLVSALKKRADPDGVKEIPIRQIGSNRIEIILPQASNEEVEDVKKMLVDQGALEFRILANHKHDAGVIPRARARWAEAAAVRLQVGAAGRDLQRDQSHRPGQGARGPEAGLEEGPLRREGRLADGQGRHR